MNEKLGQWPQEHTWFRENFWRTGSDPGPTTDHDLLKIFLKFSKSRAMLIHSPPHQNVIEERVVPIKFGQAFQNYNIVDRS